MDAPAAIQPQGAASNGAASGVVKVKLGEYEYPVYPQRIGYLKNRLGKTFGSLEELANTDVSGGTANVVDALGGKVHQVLKVFYPRLMPEWEFLGYAGPDVYEKAKADMAKVGTDDSDEGGESPGTAPAASETDYYDEEADRSPTFPELVTAFETAMRVNRFDLAGQLKNFLSLDLLQGLSDMMVARMIPEPNSQTTTSPSSLPQSTDGRSTTSGSTDQT